MNRTHRSSIAILILFLISIMNFSMQTARAQEATVTLNSGMGTSVRILPEDRIAIVAAAQGVPSVEFTHVPPYLDAKGILRGRVVNIDPATHKIACYIKVVTGWWPKPTFANRTVPVRNDGTWECDITTGGIDEQATEIIACAIPNSVPDVDLPTSPEDGIDAIAVACRQTTRSSPLNAAPRRNYFKSLPVLTWNRVTGAVCYDLQVDNNSNFSSPEYERRCIPTLYDSIAFLANNTYYWRVRAKDGSKVGSWSATSSFIVNVQ